MSDGPWKADGRPRNGGWTKTAKSMLPELVMSGFVVGVAVVGVALMPPEWTGAIKDDPRVDRAAYARLADLARSCPAARPGIRRAMMDGFATQSEVDTITRLANDRLDVYLEASARNDAAVASGAPAVKVPPRCQGK